MRSSLRATLVACVAVVLLAAATASAVAAPKWQIDALANTAVQPGDIIDYKLQMTNAGDRLLDESGSVTVTGALPAGLTVADPTDPRITDPSSPHFVEIQGVGLAQFGFVDFSVGWFPCTQSDGVTPLAGGESSFMCVLPNPSNENRWRIVLMPLAVSGSLSEGDVLTTHFTAEGAGAPLATGADPTRISADPAGFGVDAFDGQLVDAAGNLMTQAGGRPAQGDVSIDFNKAFDGAVNVGQGAPSALAKDVFVDLPPGFIGNPTAVDQCTLADLANVGAGFNPLPLCPPTSQIGTVTIRSLGYPAVRGPYPVFNVVPPPDRPARFGFNIFGSVVSLDAEVRSDGDYGITIAARNLPAALGVSGTTVRLWGVPSDPSHTFERACPGRLPPVIENGPTCASGAPPKPLLRNPTACTDPGVGLPTTARVNSWNNPGVFETNTWFTHRQPGYPLAPEDWGAQIGPTGCDRVPFDPTLTGRPAIRRVNSPTGFTFELGLPQDDSNPTGVAQSDLRSASVTLPAGVRVSPSSADGLKACSSAQIGLRERGAPTCPEASKIATVTVETPLLPDPLQGAVYLATPRQNPFGNLLTIYLVAEGPGVILKLAGRIDADPITGQLRTTFDDNPQLPFSKLRLVFDGGPRAALVTPRQCGTYTTHAQLTGWSGRSVPVESSFEVSADGNGAACPGPKFAPKLDAGTTNPVAGSTSTFVTRITRDDADQELGGLRINPPEGLLGYISKAELCSDAAANAGTCGEASRIASVSTGAGAGSHLFYITNGRAYITGPYKGAPFGLSIVVPAVAGPFDLGTVVVRASIFVDKHNATLRIVSDPLPTILEGIPLQVRDVRVEVDKPGFILNPTSCAEKAITGEVTSTEGTRAAVSSRFQVGDCARLGLRPSIRLTVGGRGKTQRGRTTTFTTELRMPERGANLRSVRVALPITLNARLDVVNRACTRDQFEAGDCERARAGSATVHTPLLRDPLSGGVYFVRNGNPLPDLFVALRGQVDFDLIGRVSIPNGKRLGTTFSTAPDVPFSRFVLRLVSGRKGPVGNAANLCRPRSRRATAEVDFIGQNGKVLQLDKRLTIKGCKKRAARGRRGRRGGRRNRR